MMQVGMSIVVVYLQDVCLEECRSLGWLGLTSHGPGLPETVIHGVPCNRTAVGDKFQITLLPRSWLGLSFHPNVQAHHEVKRRMTIQQRAAHHVDVTNAMWANVKILFVQFHVFFKGHSCCHAHIMTSDALHVPGKQVQIVAIPSALCHYSPWPQKMNKRPILNQSFHVEVNRRGGHFKNQQSLSTVTTMDHQSYHLLVSLTTHISCSYIMSFIPIKYSYIIIFALYVIDTLLS